MQEMKAENWPLNFTPWRAWKAVAGAVSVEWWNGEG